MKNIRDEFTNQILRRYDNKYSEIKSDNCQDPKPCASGYMWLPDGNGICSCRPDKNIEFDQSRNQGNLKVRFKGKLGYTVENDNLKLERHLVKPRNRKNGNKFRYYTPKGRER